MRILLVILFLYSFSAQNFPQGSVLLVGGGSENYNDWSDQPYRWLVEKAPNRKILVLHYSTTTTFFSGYLPSLSPCTVSNLAITSIIQANDSATYQFILEHDGIFLRGGDQAQYFSKWKGTLTEQALREVFQRGGVVGGTSAGEMVLSDVSYLAGNSDTGALLRIPTNSITLSDNFLPLVPNILAESHTNERGRLGRLPVFLARYKNSDSREITGIGVDVNTAIAIGADGIGEVMGGSAVSILRWTPSTEYLIESGKAFSMQNMKFDQLLPGYKINLITGEIILPPTAVSFNPKQISFPNSAIILDGSENQTDWASAEGSLKKLQSVLNNSNDIVGIFSSSSSVASANFINSTLNTWGITSQILLIDENHKNDPLLTSSISSCNAFVFVSNSLDSLAGFLDPVNTTGNAFAVKVDEGKPILFLSEDVMLAGEKAIGGLYISLYSAYYGTLNQLPGLDLVRGVQFVPRFYQNLDNTRSYDYSENRIMGMFWSMCKSQLPYGLLIDAGTFVTIINNKIEVSGVSTTSTPALLFDARNANWTDFPLFHRPGKPNAVQNAALIGATLNILRSGDSNIITNVDDNRNLNPKSFYLEQNYPNPFNPETTISFSIADAGTYSIKIYDTLGREVKTLINNYLNSGYYNVVWNAFDYGSGIYFARINKLTESGKQSQTIKLVFIK